LVVIVLVERRPVFWTEAVAALAGWAVASIGTAGRLVAATMAAPPTMNSRRDVALVVAGGWFMGSISSWGKTGEPLT
jgi:hypothetical protein